MSAWTYRSSERAPGADSEEKHEPVSDIDTVVVDSLKALDPEWPIREADTVQPVQAGCPMHRPRPFAARKVGRREANVSRRLQAGSVPDASNPCIRA